MGRVRENLDTKAGSRDCKVACLHQAHTSTGRLTVSILVSESMYTSEVGRE